MDQRTAQLVLVFFNLVAIVAVGYVIYEYLRIMAAIDADDDAIPFDSGIFVLGLTSIFWLFSAIQLLYFFGYSVLVERWANKAVIGWFFACLGFAFVFPQFVQKNLQDSGYTACENPNEVSRTSAGKSYIYRKSGCELLD